MSGYAVGQPRGLHTLVCLGCGQVFWADHQAFFCGAWRAHRREARAARTPDGPLVGHCGMWHKITALPLRLPCCGWVLGEDARDEALPV